MLHYETVDAHTLELLKSLMQEPLLNNYYLVGGTALALQLGHRKSVNLDLFGMGEIEAESVKEILRKYGNIKVLKESTNIKIYIVGETKVDFVNFSYPMIDKRIVDGKLRLASTKDIAAMKINAIEGRGSKKDFIDVYFLLKQYTLNEMLRFYSMKYPEHSEFRALMSLTYFSDADEQQAPIMLQNVCWNDVKKEVLSEVKSYNQEYEQ